MTPSSTVRAERTPNPRGQGRRLGVELIEAATRLLEEGGRDADITLRGVARAAGVAAPSVYAHYADLDALMLELVRHHLAHLTRHVEGAVARSDASTGGEAGARDRGTSPDAARRRVEAMAHAYVDWGLAHPGPYTVVFEGRVLRHLTRDEELALLAGDDLMAGLVRLVAHARGEVVEDTGEVSPDSVLAATTLWSSLHGIVALRTAKPAYPWPELRPQVDLVLDVWRAALSPTAPADGRA